MIFNAYYFSTVTVVTRTRLNGTLCGTLPVLLVTVQQNIKLF